jgi:hypothetical protein
MSNRRLRREHRLPKRIPLLKRIFRNRYSGSNWVSLADVLENVKETWFSFTNRVPPGSRLIRRAGKIVGYTSTWRGPNR